MKGWLIRAQQPRSKRISCKGYPPPPPRELWSYVRAGRAPPGLTRSFCILQSCPVDFHSTYNIGIGIGNTRTPPLPRRRELLSYVRASCAPPPGPGPILALPPPPLPPPSRELWSYVRAGGAPPPWRPWTSVQDARGTAQTAQLVRAPPHRYCCLLMRMLRLRVKG